MTRLSDEDREIVAGLSEFIQKRVGPLEESNSKTLHDPTKLYDLDSGRYSDEARKLFREVRIESAEAGFYTLAAPVSIGGAALGATSLYRVWESLHRVHGPAVLLPYAAVAHWTSGPSFLCELMTPKLRESVVPSIVSGERTGCFAMSEADAGSDAWAMRTSARRDGNDWILNGEKMWISNGPTADFAFVFAVTDEDSRRRRDGGITCFYVPTDSSGYSMDSVIKLFGHVGGNEAIISFTDVRVPEENIVGALGDGFSLALRGLSNGRMYNAGRSVGLAKWALRQAVDYSRERKTFGKPISDYQGVSFQLADSAIEIYAADTMAADCAQLLDDDMDASTQMAMVKAYTTETAFRVYDRVMQVHGAMGLTSELGIYQGWHDTRIIRIADGSAEVMRRNIARLLLKGRYQF